MAEDDKDGVMADKVLSNFIIMDRSDMKNVGIETVLDPGPFS